ncbi:copper radical oxidase [Amniculicola lignicola CBS 123094]|uniref:Copper radical oxidase n=1 Tax=Amniculicola lignicola CBS 123094 TaxID=1392246 RepID=A0A6A5X350_9PLEO|nr:copper radical oxidase [Amniculicola lignicola CBS 123094]
MIDIASSHSGLGTLLFLTSVTFGSANTIEKRDLYAPPSPFTGWGYAGCFNDSVGARTLTQNGFTSSAMTNTQCVQFCASKGFYYAGTEYSAECYCGDSLKNYGAKVDNAGDCNMPCNGNATEQCGGPSRLTMYNTTLPTGPIGPFINPGVNGFGYLGCYVDSVNTRTLGNGMQTTGGAGSLTVALCTSACHAGGYKYSGVEYSGECYCDDEIRNLGAPADASGCSMSCNGNSTEFCGGSNRLSLYQFGYKPPVLSSTASMMSSSSATSMSSSTVVSMSSNTVQPSSASPSSSSTMSSSPSSSPVVVSSGSTSSSLSSMTPTSSSTMISSSSSSSPVVVSPTSSTPMSTLIDSSTMMSSSSSWVVPPSSSSWAVPPSSSSWAVPPSSSSWAIPPSSSSLVVSSSSSTPVTSKSSSTVDSSGSSTFISSSSFTAVSSSSSVVVLSSSPTPIPPSSSSMAVSSSSSVVIPPSSSTSVPLSSSFTVATTSTTTTTPTPTTTIYSYKGCWVDNKYGRVMNYQQPDNSTETVDICIALCRSQGYAIAGIEYGVQCFCDNFLRNAATNTSDTECNMACPGNSTQKCGDGNRLSVYSNLTDITVYPVPTVQTTDLPGSWKYAGCLTDDAPNQRALPWQIILTDNNTAPNCIAQCSAYGYASGGLEYGNECYCGDQSDVDALGLTYVSENECQFACSGNVTTICGGARRLSYYTWQGPPLTSWNYASDDAAGLYQFLIGGVVVPLVTQMAVNGKVTFLEKSGTGIPNATGAYELDLAQINNFTGAWRPMHLKTDVFCSASVTLPDKAARQINVGGWSLDSTFGVRLYWPDGSPGVWGVNDWKENFKLVSLQAGRWYPSSMILANGSLLVVGGERGSNDIATPSLEILPQVGPTVYCDWLNRTDPSNLYPFLAVLPSGGVFVAYYNEARILDEASLLTKKELPNIPGAVNNFLAGRTYPMQGTAVLLPQSAPYTDPLKILICGGSTPYQGFALDNCVSIAPEAPNATWILERMPSKRVLVSLAALPDGTYLILNGAHQGFGGFGLATDPNHNAVLYDPTKPLNNRFTVMANTTIDRLYHNEAILLDDGRVLVSGSDPEDYRYDQEYRVEVFIPPYLMGNLAATRPIVNIPTNQRDWAYGQSYQFTLQTAVTITKVSLMGAGSATHGNSMGQRTIFPAFSCSGRICKVTAPPNARICPPGWFQLFALNRNNTPSVAVWVRIGGDPAGFGNWPDFDDFRPLPGV